MCDSESSDDEGITEKNEIVTNKMSEFSEDEDNIVKPKPYKRKTKPKNEEKVPKKVRFISILDFSIKIWSLFPIQNVYLSFDYYCLDDWERSTSIKKRN